MNAKYLIIASLILAILTIGAVSASQDIAADDELAVNDDAIEIEEAPADDAGVIDDSKDSDTLEKSNDAEELGVGEFDFWCNSTVDLDDDEAIAVTADLLDPEIDGSARIDVTGDEFEDSYYWDFDESSQIELTLDDLHIYNPGSYKASLIYIFYDESLNPVEMTVDTGNITVTETYDADDFETRWGEIYSKNDEVVTVFDFPTEGTLIVYVDGDKRFTTKIDDEIDEIYVFLSDLNIASNGEYTVSVQFIVDATGQVVDVDEKDVTVDVDWATDDYVQVSSEVDFLSHYDPVVCIEDYDDFINGTITVSVDGRVFTKNIPASQKEDAFYVTVDDLGLYNNIALGNHTVKAVYMRNGKESHELERLVEFTATPDFVYSESLSVGEKETLVINYLKTFTGTATLYNARWEDEDLVKGSVAGSAKFSNGVATIPFGSLSKGAHYFLVNITGYPSEQSIDVYVSENTPGLSASVSASEITVGGSVVVKFNSPASTNHVQIDVDGNPYASVIASGAVSQEIKGLAAGTHKIKVFFEDEGKFYSNTFYVNVKNPTSTPTPVKKNTIKLTLKKVKVKKSAKKLVLQATLKINGKAAPKKIIKFKFNKKTYKAKTNKKGVAKVTIKKKVLKKLKVGKKVKIQATYGKVTKKLTVKVKK